jgi:hypothetical protein
MKLSRRDREILEIAVRETDPKNWPRFQPITRGPVVAVLGIVTFGALGVIFWVMDRVWKK